MSDEACGIPAGCVKCMLSMLENSIQPAPQRLLAGHTLASLLRSHKCQRTALRCAACRPLTPGPFAIGPFAYRHGMQNIAHNTRSMLPYLAPAAGRLYKSMCLQGNGWLRDTCWAHDSRQGA